MNPLGSRICPSTAARGISHGGGGRRHDGDDGHRPGECQHGVRPAGLLSSRRGSVRRNPARRCASVRTWIQFPRMFSIWVANKPDKNDHRHIDQKAPETTPAAGSLAIELTASRSPITEVIGTPTRRRPAGRAILSSHAVPEPGGGQDDRPLARPMRRPARSLSVSGSDRPQRRDQKLLMKVPVSFFARHGEGGSVASAAIRVRMRSSPRGQ